MKLILIMVCLADDYNRKPQNTIMIHAFPEKYHIEHGIYEIEVDKGNHRVIIMIDKINQEM